jgi:2-phosphosulfolactate phosphatase
VGAFDQGRYQVRLDWGLAGLERLAPADVYVIVDVLRFSSSVAAAVTDGGTVSVDAARSSSINGAPLAAAAAALPHGPLVLAGSLRNASAIARAIKAEQERRSARTSVAILPAGERGAGDAVRFAVEDQLGAGAIVDALVPLGIDHSSPEAVVAAESFAGLRRAVKHLLTASASGLELAEVGRVDEVRAAAAIDDLDAVPVLRDGAFTAL